MKKLLSMELKRAFLSPVLWISVITEICINVYAIISSSYGFTIYTTSFLFEHSGLLCIMIAIFISLHISHDFEVRTINNKIAAGYSRKQIYLTEVVTSAICSSFLFIADIIIIFIFICSLIKQLEFSNRVTYTAFDFPICPSEI